MTVHVTPTLQTADGLARRTFDARDVRRMVDVGVLDEDERVELVEGELLKMAAKGFAHDRVKNEINKLCVRAFSDAVYVAVESTLQLGGSTLLEPDILVAREDAVIRSQEGFVTFAQGGIILAVEVAVSSLAYDRGRKAALYARFGVPEYWVIDAKERVAWSHTEPGEDGYGRVFAASRTDVLRPRAPELTRLAVDLAKLG